MHEIAFGGYLVQKRIKPLVEVCRQAFKRKLQMKLTKLTIKRLENNKTQEQIAKYLDVRRSLISDIESHNVLLMPDSIKQLAELYQTPVDELYPNELLRDICRVYKPKALEQDREQPAYYHFHVRIRVDTLSSKFTMENLRKCGYKDQTQWLYAKIKEFETELLKTESQNEFLTR